MSSTDRSGAYDFSQQCLRVLRCTAEAMASSPGGLRFKAGARPWLDGLKGNRLSLASGGGRHDAASVPAAGP